MFHALLEASIRIGAMTEFWYSVQRRDVFRINPRNLVRGTLGNQNYLFGQLGLRSLITRADFGFSRLEDAPIPAILLELVGDEAIAELGIVGMDVDDDVGQVGVVEISHVFYEDCTQSIFGSGRSRICVPNQRMPDGVEHRRGMARRSLSLPTVYRRPGD